MCVQPKDVQIARCTRFPRFDTGLSGEAGKEILVPYPADEMTWPISPRVNNPKNNDAAINDEDRPSGRHARYLPPCALVKRASPQRVGSMVSLSE
jgi:hypothetical protein